MPNKAKSHHDFCGALCLMCLKKGPQLRSITSGGGARGPVRTHDYAVYIKDMWWKDYDSTDIRVPRVLCMNCRLQLINHREPIDNNPDPLPPRIKYEDNVIRPVTRKALPCDCDICLRGRFTFKELNVVPKCSIITGGTKIVRNKKTKRGQETVVVTRCSKCHQVIGRGIKHSCTRSNKQVNIDDLVRSASDKSRSKVLAGIFDLVKSIF